ncbi:MAG: hypothetical protein J6T74_08090 [Clostridia bacterium]|nr:hypothetical protein [Clostridia bacterium]
MEQKYWGKSNELYNILYEDDRHILVQNDETKTYSFGMPKDFGSLYGFPINQSILTKSECINLLKRFIEIDKKYNDVNKTQKFYETMILILEGQNEYFI